MSVWACARQILWISSCPPHPQVRMPDVEFFVNLGDWPLEKKKSNPNIQPIFSWCGSTDSRDIVMPTYDLTDSVLETMGRWDMVRVDPGPWFARFGESFSVWLYELTVWEEDMFRFLSFRVSLDMMSVQANTGPPWERKNSTAVWRGRDSRKERLELVKLSRKHPELIDAAFTNFFFFKHDESLYGPIVKHISFFDFFKVWHHLWDSFLLSNLYINNTLGKGTKVYKFQGMRKYHKMHWVPRRGKVARVWVHHIVLMLNKH